METNMALGILLKMGRHLDQNENLDPIHLS